MAENYHPYILGTNHLSYNVEATISYVDSLDLKIKKVMLEMFNSNDTTNEFIFEFVRTDAGLELESIRNNPNVFYSALVDYFNSRQIEMCFAYSEVDPVTEIKAVVDFNSNNYLDLVASRAKEFSDEMDPLILKRVLQQSPDLIIIGSAHGEYLNNQISGSNYVYVDDKEKFPIFQAHLFNYLLTKLQ